MVPKVRRWIINLCVGASCIGLVQGLHGGRVLQVSEACPYVAQSKCHVAVNHH